LLAFALIGVAFTALMPPLGLTVQLAVPVIVLAVARLLRALRTRNSAQREQLGLTSACAADIVSGLRILCGIGGKEKFVEKFSIINRRVCEVSQEAGRIEASVAAVGILLPGLVSVLVVWLGARLTLSGSISAGQLVTLYGATTFLVLAIQNIIDTVNTLSLALVGSQRLCDVLAIGPFVSTDLQPLAFPDHPVSLRDETTGLTIRCGMLTTINATSEQTRLFALRLGGQANRGSDEEIYVNDVPLSLIDKPAARQKILLSSHFDVLFSGTVVEEVVGAREHLDISYFNQVLQACQLKDVIDMLPNGLDERLLGGGQMLSGGQRQRLLLARALYAEAEILILDHPTSAVDARTEASIADQVARLRHGMTTTVFSESGSWRRVSDENHDIPATISVSKSGNTQREASQ
jgi:ABC-type bacteriocin/lantibiotic exporter with double-glycine peptidase domain